MSDEEQNELMPGRLLEARELRRPLLEMTIYTVEDLAAVVAIFRGEVSVDPATLDALADQVHTATGRLRVAIQPGRAG